MARDARETVMAYIAAAQRLRATGSADDVAAVRALLDDDVTILLAAPWAEEPWVVAHSGAGAVLERLSASVNASSNLTTVNSTVVAEGDLVFVEQRSTLATPDGARTSAVGHLFRVTDGRISSIKTFRNDRGLPGS